MNRYFLIRRLRGPAILLLIGILALLHSTGVLDSFWRWFWPLLLIGLGVMLLAERALLAADGGFQAWPQNGAPNQYPPYPAQQGAEPETAIVPSQTNDFGKNQDGGQS